MTDQEWRTLQYHARQAVSEEQQADLHMRYGREDLALTYEQNAKTYWRIVRRAVTDRVSEKRGEG